MKTSYVVFFLLFTHFSFCQLNENFSDGDFTNNPVWQGDIVFFKVNHSFALQSQGPGVSGSIQFVTQSHSTISTQWEFLVRMEFEPSTTNYTKVYLVSDQPDLKGNLNGYYLKIGGENGTSDRIELYRQTGNSSTKLISGTSGNVGRAINNIRIRALRDYSGTWTLFSDTSGLYDFSLEGIATDLSPVSGSYFGQVCTHTSTRKDLFFWDDIIISPIPLFPVSAKALSNTEIRLSFSKPIAEQSAKNQLNYFLEGRGNPSSVFQNSANSVDLVFEESIQKGNSTLEIRPIMALDGSILNDTFFSFVFEPPLNYGDLLITEIYPDPTPTNGLPEEEFIELYNTTNDTIDLDSYSYSDASTESMLSNAKIPPHSYLILSSSSGSNSYQSFGDILTVSPWPSLNNSEDYLCLKDKNGRKIFDLNYSIDWLNDDEKKEGGWSLEMINFSDFCSSSNWKASISGIGGTPGIQNSVYNLQNDTIPPGFISFDIQDSLHISLQWDEELDTLENPSISCGENLLQSYFQSPTKITIVFPKEKKENCELKIENIKDCKGNIISPMILPITFPQQEAPLDLVINEALFNPRSGGVDFIEIYNRSPKVIDLKNWRIASLKNGDTASAAIFSSSFLLAPFSYLTFCPSVSLLESQYYIPYPERIIEVSYFPGYNDDSGVILLLNSQKMMIDRFDYHEDYHLKILQDNEGISLERISFSGPSNDPNNWHSAAASSGFATPGFENSQHFGNAQIDQFKAEPKIFTPNQDGDKDFTLIHYQFDSPGYICNLSIFDLAGRKINSIAENYLVGKEGYFEWGGVGFGGELATSGLYILLLEAFNSNGKMVTWKGTVILSQKF